MTWLDSVIAGAGGKAAPPVGAATDADFRLGGFQFSLRMAELHKAPLGVGVNLKTWLEPSGSLSSPDALYRNYVSADLGTLVGQTDALLADVRAGNLSAARQAWLTAHLTYERLGAAYGTFGDFDTEIDGRADGLPGGVNSPGFTGFYETKFRGPDGVVFDVSEHPWPGLEEEKVKAEAAE